MATLTRRNGSALVLNCMNQGGTEVRPASQGGPLAIGGYVTDITAHLDGLPVTSPDEEPALVRIYTFEDGTSAPVATTTVALDTDGSFSTTVTAGDTYRLDLLDVLARPSAAGMVTAIAVDATSSWAAYLSGLAEPGADHDYMYTLVEDYETLAVQGTLTPDDPGGPSIAKLRYGVIEGGFWKTDTTISVVPDGSGAVAVNLPADVFAPGCGYVALIVQDITGSDVASSFVGSASTPTVTYTVDQATPGGFVMFDASCATGFDKDKWCKKDELETLYLKKKGKPTGAAAKDPMWCTACPEGGAVPADGKVDSKKKLIEAPPVSCDQHAGIAAADGDVYIECQRFYNKDSASLEERRTKVPNTPTRKSGVDYTFTAFEPPSAQGNGKSVVNYKWWQRVKYSVTYTTDSGSGTGSSSNGKYEWDDKKAKGGTTPDHSYEHQTQGAGSAGPTSVNDLNAMEDSPGLGVPTNAAEAHQLACDVGIQGADKDNWKTITFTAEFQTILICCAETPSQVIAVYHWTLTVTITKNGDGTYSSSVSTTSGGPQEQVNEDNTPKIPTDEEWEMPC